MICLCLAQPYVLITVLGKIVKSIGKIVITIVNNN